MAAFPETRWTLVSQARDRNPDVARQALGELLAAYSAPVDSFLKSMGYSAQDVSDIRQAFFTDLLEHGAITKARSEYGSRFRAFLKGCLRNYLGHMREREKAKRRGGGVKDLPLEIDDGQGSTRYIHEPADPSTPEREFDRSFAQSLVRLALEKLRSDCASSGRLRDYEVYEPYLTAESPEHEALGEVLGISTGASRVRLKRLRDRLDAFVLECAADLVAHPTELEDELQQILM